MIRERKGCFVLWAQRFGALRNLAQTTFGSSAPPFYQPRLYEHGERSISHEVGLVVELDNEVFGLNQGYFVLVLGVSMSLNVRVSPYRETVSRRRRD
jgi:hypothetical protein